MPMSVCGEPLARSKCSISIGTLSFAGVSLVVPVVVFFFRNDAEIDYGHIETVSKVISMLHYSETHICTLMRDKTKNFSRGQPKVDTQLLDPRYR